MRRKRHALACICGAFFALVPAAFPLLAQESDTLAQLRAAAESDNFRALTQYAADVTVVATKRVPRTDFFLWYGHLTNGSWGSDKNWYPTETEGLFLSLPGEDGSSDVVWSQPLDTCWSRPMPVCAAAVSPGSEVFPMLSPDGRRLYFASDGLFGMGGYDLYVATWDPQERAWSHVQNMGFPFNSRGDDLLFCDTPDGRYSLFASNRDCGRDSVVIYVLRQETPVWHAIDAKDVAARSRLAVTAPDNGYPFQKQAIGPVPSLRFEEPLEVEQPFRIGKEGAFARDNSLPEGVVYQIQLFVMGSTPSVKQLKGVSPVYSHPQRSGKRVYAAGLFRTYAEAEQALSSVRRAGFPSAYVIAFENGKSITLQQARKKESSVKVITEEVRIVR